MIARRMPHGGCPKATVAAADLVGGQCRVTDVWQVKLPSPIKDENIHSFDAQ